MSTNRETFERNFPKPTGVSFNEGIQKYEAGVYSEPSVGKYNAIWKGWQAAHAQDGGEPVGAVNKARLGVYEFFPSSALTLLPDGIHKLYVHPPSTQQQPAQESCVAQPAEYAEQDSLLSVDSLQQPNAVAPKGWKLVPLEPTGRMLKHGTMARTISESGSDGVYKSMIEAAPNPPSAVVSIGWKLQLEKALSLAKVFDDGSDGADGESAAGVVSILSGLLKSAPNLPGAVGPEDVMARIKNLLLALGHQGSVLDEGQPPYDIGEWGVKEAQELYELIAQPEQEQE